MPATASTSTLPAAVPPAYLQAPFISSKAIGENQSTVNEGNGASASASSSSPSPSSSSPRRASPSNDEGSRVPSHLYSNLAPHLLLPDGTPDYLRMSLSADIYSLVKQTPLQRANNLSAKLGCEIFLKREDLQPVFSFKLRGAYNLMRTLEGEQRWKGVIACSAGNHAQGVSLSGLSLSIPCTIVMPLGTPSIKVSSVRALGAKVVLHGQDFDEAKAECSRLAETYGLKVIPPFDDPHVIAGQGTTAVELLRQTSMEDLEGVFCCVGGGGLLAGVAAYTKRIAPPTTKVFGVETFDGDALTRSLQQGKRVTLTEVGLFADGTAVKVVGEECWRLLKQPHMVDGMVRVDTDEICAAIRDVFEDTRSVPEPSGALSLAGLKRYILHHNMQGSGKKFACVVSGANMNFSRLRFVAERAEVGDGKEVMMMVEIPEEPGSFQKLHSHIHPRSITEFSYRYSAAQGAERPTAHIYLSFLLNGSTSSGANGSGNGDSNAQLSAAAAAAAATASAVREPTAAQPAVNGNATHTVAPATAPAAAPAVNGHSNHHTAAFNLDGLTANLPPSAGLAGSAGLPVGGQPATATSSSPTTARQVEVDSIISALSTSGMRAIDISSNEMAKSHGRYLVGGRQSVPNERLFRFEFPERPGALRKFLVGINAGWNISLWHYRNQGGDTAKVLVGVQVEEGQREAFQRFLDELGYWWREETDNEVATRFL